MVKSSGSPGQLSDTRRPPNYFARSVQIRLFAAVISLMLVLTLMVEARKPENWSWMWAGQQRLAAASQPQLDTRLGPSTPPDLPGTVSAATPVSSGSSPGSFSPGMAPINQVEQHAWSTVLAPLNREERVTLDGVLRSRQRGTAGTLGLGATWGPVLEKLTTGWVEYLNGARSALADLPDLERLAWTKVLDTADNRWQKQWLPTLESAEAQAWTSAQIEILASLQQFVDRFAWDQVEDDTVFRAGDHDAWFRCLEKLAGATAAEIRRESIGRVSFVQLFRQPTEYRGKVVTVQGSLRLAYQVPARDNEVGIKDYYVFWLKPAGSQLSPLIVYSLDAPDGFPEIPDRYGKQGSVELNEDLEFDAYFFKRQAYRARDGVNTAPVLLAKAPYWTPSQNATRQAPYPPVSAIAIALTVLLFVAVGLAWMARGPRVSTPRVAARDDADWKALQGRPTAPPLKDELQQLTRRARHE